MRRLLSAVALCVLAAGCGSSGSGPGGRSPAAVTPTVTPTLTVATTPSPTVSTAPAAATGPSVERPCSFLTAPEMSALLGRTVTVQDEGFRCKYVQGDGWLQVELMEFAGGSAQQIYTYDKAHGTAAPGVGDEAYLFGAAIVAKVGDALLAVDGNNLPQPPPDATLTAIAKAIASRVP